MKLVVNRTPREDNNTNQITKINRDQKLISVFKKKTNSNSHQVKPKPNNSSCTLIENIWLLS